MERIKAFRLSPTGVPYIPSPWSATTWAAEAGKKCCVQKNGVSRASYAGSYGLYFYGANSAIRDCDGAALGSELWESTLECSAGPGLGSYSAEPAPPLFARKR